MSRCADVFMSDFAESGAVVSATAQLLGVEPTMRASDWGHVQVFRCVGHEFVLIHDHGLVDDGGLDFSAFAWQISIQSFDLAVSEEALSDVRLCLARMIAEHLAKQLGCSTMAVDNLQRLIWKSS